MKRKFTGKEVENAICENDIETIYGENGRWSRNNTIIVKMPDDGKYYRLEWDEGLTEYQDSDFPDQEAPEVEKIEEVVTVTKWIEI